jgi:ParB family transcriptional regulator, chromosome partitioning protein
MVKSTSKRLENLNQTTAEILSGREPGQGVLPSRPAPMLRPRLVNLHPDQIEVRSPVQTRPPFDPEQDPQDVEFVQSIRKHGVLQPVLAYALPEGSGYGLIAGHRRVDAVRSLGMDSLPAILLPGPPEPESRDVWTALENLQRKDLKPLEKAEQLQQLAARYNYTQKELAAMVGLSPAQVSHLLSLLSAPPEVKEAVNAGRLGVRNAREVVRLPEQSRREVLEMAKRGIKLSAALKTAAAPAEEPASPLSPQPAPTQPVAKSSLPPEAGPLEQLLGESASLFARELEAAPFGIDPLSVRQTLLAGLWLAAERDLVQAWQAYRDLPDIARASVEKLLLELHRLSVLQAHTRRPYAFEPVRVVLHLAVQALLPEKTK